MKTDLRSLQDSFEAWYFVNEKSRRETSVALNMFHNRQWAPEQVLELENRGQPKETFNIVKLFTRMLVGYYSSVVNKAEVEPRGYDDITKATMMNDALKVVYESNNFETIDDDVKQNGFLSGLFCTYTTVTVSDKQDVFGRNEYKINIEDINPEELVIDPLSKKRNGSDSRGTHRFTWLSAEQVKQEFGKKQKTLDKLETYSNHVEVDEAEFTYRYDTEFNGKYKVEDMYLVVHSVMRNTKGDWESIHWTGKGHAAIELSRAKLNFDIDMSPYTVTRVHKSNKEEYYGIFREVIEAQKAINQALIQIQLLVNSNKVIVETDAVDDIDEFATSISRVNAVIEVENLQGVLIQEMSRDIGAQYVIIDKALDRIKLLIGVNDAMLGMAMASDSGRKIKLQKNTGIMTLRYLTSPIEVFHKTQATLLVGLIAQFYTSHQVMRVTDEITGNRFVEINKPLLLPKLPPELSQLVSQGMPIEYALEAMMTGQLNPMIAQAQQSQEIASQQYQEEQAQAQDQMQTYQQERQTMIDNGQNVSSMTPPPMTQPGPPPNVISQMPKVDIENAAKSSEQTQMNKAMSIKRPDAPPQMQYLYEEMLDPITGQPARNKEGQILMTPVADSTTTLDIKEYDISIKPSKYDDEDEKAQLMLEVMLNGPAGQFIMNASPAKYAKMLSLNIQSSKTKHSPEIAKMINDLAQQMGENPQFESYMRQVSAGIPPGQQQAQPGEAADGGMIPSNNSNGPGATTGKLPQNTNEG